MAETQFTRESLTQRQRYWLEHIQAWKRSGTHAAQYAQAHQLNAKSLYQWQSTLRKRGVLKESEPPKLVRVHTPTVNASAQRCLVHLPGGVQMQISEALALSVIQACLGIQR
jgi:hypothetical protein